MRRYISSAIREYFQFLIFLFLSMSIIFIGGSCAILYWRFVMPFLMGR